MKNHILYSYRRCPYAMRARMALVVAAIQCDVHEVDFKDKPVSMLEVSPKGTVPVLVMVDNKVLDESLDIVNWSLAQHDPQGWLDCDLGAAKALISKNDGAFKAALDRYKYPNRFEGEDCSGAREQGLAFLRALNERLLQQDHLMGARITMADIAIFPFVRQFSNVDRPWFDAQELPALQKWLVGYLESDLFTHIFKKQNETVYTLL